MSEPILHTDSLEERIRDVRHRLALIESTAELMLEQFDEDETPTRLEAICEAAREASEILEPIAHAPGPIANWSPATPTGARR